MPPNFKAWLQLEKIIKKENPDIVYLHGYGLILINIISNICKKLNIKYIYTLHGAPVTQNKVGGVIKFAYNIYRNLYGYKTLKNAYKITAVSQYTTEFEEFADFKDSIVVINNGIDTEQYISLKKELKLKNSKKDHIEIVSLGRLEWLKGFQYFIDIIPDLIKRGHNIKYKIAGKDNGLKNELEEKISKLNIKEHVIFVGQVDFEDKVKLILNSDYVLVPSLIENYPAVPIEAIILGKPVVANKAGGIPEIVKDNVNGFLTDVTDKKVFLKDMLNILGKQYNSKAQDIDFYDWKEKVNEYIKLI
jgi:glycosyltransferase involved in cell wall biosynthesis